MHDRPRGTDLIQNRGNTVTGTGVTRDTTDWGNKTKNMSTEINPHQGTGKNLRTRIQRANEELER